jgi:hypothetical protein
MSRNSLFFVCLALFQAHVSALTTIQHQKIDSRNFALAETKGDKERTPSRRSFLNDVGIASLTLASVFAVQAEPAFASGGATAGGVYLLSAKQRYNNRVTKAVKELLVVAGTLESGSVAEAKAYFSGEEVGEWKDFAAAGYLLSNAFRRTSSAAPDTLPAVKVRCRPQMAPHTIIQQTHFVDF